MGDAGAALLALLVATTLSVYKPRGMTPYGWRKQNEERGDTDAAAGGGSASSTPSWVKTVGFIVLVLVLLFVILHLSGHGLGGH